MKTTIKGRYVKGLGKGKYFMRQQGYKSQFIRKLGIDPYHGTFNVRLSGASLALFRKLVSGKGIMIRGFRKGGKSFGNVACYRAEICGIRCAMVVPERTGHSDVAELIAQVVLRKELDVKEGMAVTFSVSS